MRMEKVKVHEFRSYLMLINAHEFYRDTYVEKFIYRDTELRSLFICLRICSE